MYKARDILDGKYEILFPIGVGGFGQVFLARDLLLQDRLVAIKVLKEEDPSRQDNLVKEMQHLARLNNPAIVAFYHHFNHGGKLNLVMEYCEGGNLRQTATGKPAIELNQVVQWGITITEILAFVHSKGIVHHDIKPSNILLTHDGKLKLCDFGVANQNIGTPDYMPPEIFLEGYDSANDPRVDIYSLGITLLELVLGKNPFYGLAGKSY